MPTALIRATTFQIRYRGALLTARQWDAEIHRAIRAANDIFAANYMSGRESIRVALSSTVHLSEEASMALLTQSIRPESQREGGISPNAYFERERRMDAATFQARSGATGQFNYGGFLLRAFPLGSAGGPGARRAATRETLAILRLNRRAGEIATYWIPGFNEAYYGLTYMPEFYDGITYLNEGIFITHHVARDIFAHELGHLLMRAGHCTFEGPNGKVEGSAPPNNLMHGDNASRTGTDLTTGQVRCMLENGRAYLH